MSKPLRIDCAGPAQTPASAEIAKLAVRGKHVVLQFPRSFIGPEKNDVIDRLAAELPDWSVFDSGGSGMSTVTVMKVVCRAEVEAHAEGILDAARVFRSTADRLCRALAEEKGIPPDSLWDHRDRGGILPGGWNYGFHGLQCCFENASTRQIVDVETSFGGEFGVLDPYFFGEYLRSTPQFAFLRRTLPDSFHDTRRALDLLESWGRLTRVEGNLIPRNSGVVVR